jgi:SAM-dependent methyltransferase
MENTCLVCGSNSTGPEGTHHWNIYGIEYRLLKCADCGSAFTSPSPDDATLARFYKTAFNYDWYLDHFGAKLLDCQIRIEEYRKLMGPRVLDYGGGLGYFSLVARLRGYDALTYDPYTSGIEPDSSHWNTVIALHVLEHSNDPGRTLSHMKSFLAPDGKIIIAVPNYRCSGYQKLGMSWVWAQPPMMHTFHFTAIGLEGLLRRSGLMAESISYHERWDANRMMDLERVDVMRSMEAEWSGDDARTCPERRAKVAWRNSQLRWDGLQEALKDYTPDRDEYSELQIIARSG